MSTFTTSLAMLGLAALGAISWQASRPTPGAPGPVVIPADPVLASALPGLQPLPARLSSEPPRRHLILPPELGPNGMPCGLQVWAEPTAPAMVALTIQDACLPDTPVVVDHAGLRIALRTDQQGHATLLLPALSDPARVELRIADELRDAVTVAVPDLAHYHRAALAWTGPARVALHAHEMGAADRDPGHVHPGATGRPRDAILGRGGYLSIFEAAQVYTYPRDRPGRAGLVRLSVEAGCGQTVSAERFETNVDGLTRAALEIALPDCATAPPQSRLQNIYQDLRIAAR